MKIKLISFLSLVLLVLLTATNTHAQMQRSGNGFTEGDYEKCINFCKDLDNSEERLTCMRGCSASGISSVSLKALSMATSLLPELNKKPLREGENLFFTDKTSGYQYFAISNNGNLAGYQVKTKEGINIPVNIVSVQRAAVKKCYMIDPDGSWREVRCPDIIIIGYPVTKYKLN